MGSPFNGDTFIEQEFLSLKDRFSLTTAVETGTNHGDTTVWLAKNFLKTVSCEIDHNLVQECAVKFKQENVHVELFYGSSEAVLDYVIPHRGIGHDTIFFLDAHWNSYCPLLDELEAIAKYELLPVIAIHDFMVPGGGLGWDSYNGQDYTFEWIKPKLDKIYSFKNRGYKHYYNTPEKACGAMRGVIYIVPA
jgi:hypothetical protein